MTNPDGTSATALSVLRYIDWASDAARLSPVLAVRMANRGANCAEFVHTYNLALEGYGGVPLFVGGDAGHIRRRANANRKRNKAARIARRHNR